MFTRVFVPDLVSFFANSLWILAAAYLLATGGHIAFLKRTGQASWPAITGKRPFKRKLCGSALGIGVGVILSLSNAFQIREHFVFGDRFIYDEKNIRIRDMDDEWNVLGTELEMFTDAGGSYANRYRLDGDIVYMPWDGYIGTPFVRLTQGSYRLTLKAWGLKADGEFSKIIVYSLKLENDRATLLSLLRNIELGFDAAAYDIPFSVDRNGIYKLRIQFYNNVGDKKDRDRSVWISEFKISVRKPE